MCMYVMSVPTEARKKAPDVLELELQVIDVGAGKWPLVLWRNSKYS